MILIRAHIRSLFLCAAACTAAAMLLSCASSSKGEWRQAPLSRKRAPDMIGSMVEAGFLIHNTPVSSEGYTVRNDGGEILASYLLPEQVKGGPWLIDIELAAHGAEDGVVSDTDLPARLHETAEIEALFERQLFFGWER